MARRFSHRKAAKSTALVLMFCAVVVTFVWALVALGQWSPHALFALLTSAWLALVYWFAGSS